MSAEAIARTIQFILAPVVMVTSSAILISGMLALYAGINERMRALTRERLDLLREPGGALTVAATAGDAYKVERLQEIDAQLPTLLRRHELVRRGTLAGYVSIFLFVASMFVIAVAALTSSVVPATMALIIFLIGTAALLVGVLLIGLEVRLSSQAVRYEVERVLQLGQPEEVIDANAPAGKRSLS